MYSGSLIHPHIKRKLLSTIGRSYEPPPCPSPGPSVGGGKGGGDSKQLSSLRLQPLMTLLGRRILAHVNTKARSDLSKRRGGSTPESQAACGVSGRQEERRPIRFSLMGRGCQWHIWDLGLRFSFHFLSFLTLQGVEWACAQV